ncbi:MAG: surface carbohydrate biosynthesis protein [Pseudodesulfovibrio sp.]
MRLYIVVEITTREFDAKTFLACCAAAEGFDVVIGEENMLRRFAVMESPGILYDKSLHTQYPAWFQRMRRLGNRIVVNDDEGFIIDPESYAIHSMTQAACDAVDLHLTWGMHQQEILERGHAELAAKSVPVGNVRMDLLRPELRPYLQDKADVLKKRWGRIVLVNSRASVVNNAGGARYLEEFLRSEDSGAIEIRQPYIDWDTRVFQGLQDMLRAVAPQFPDHTFIVRPHPKENMAVWQRMDDEIGNVHLVREGNVHDWILAAEMVIVQHGCTTAAESFFLGTPCVSYLPVSETVIDHGLTAEVVYIANDPETVCQCLRGEREVEMSAMLPRWREAARRYVASVDGPLAAESTIRHLKEVADIDRDRELGEALRERLCGIPRSWWRRLKRSLPRRGRCGSPKWKPLTLEEFKENIDQFSFYDARFTRLEVSRVYLDCFRLRMK